MRNRSYMSSYAKFMRYEKFVECFIGETKFKNLNFICRIYRLDSWVDVSNMYFGLFERGT